MSFENSTGLNVFTSYGKRGTGGSAGSETTDGSTRAYSFTLTGASLNTAFIPNVVLPKGSRLLSAVIVVDEAFIATGGVGLAITGQGADSQGITEAEIEAVGTKALGTAAAGNWAPASVTGTSAASKFSLLKAGTFDPTKGKATVILTFFNKSKG